VKGAGDLFGNCGKRCAPNKPLNIPDCKEQLCGTRDTNKPALRKIPVTGKWTLNDFKMEKGQDGLIRKSMEPMTDVRKKAPRRMVQTSQWYDKVRAEGMKKKYTTQELQGGIAQPKTPAFATTPPPDDPRSVAMRAKLIPELKRLKAKSEMYEPGNVNFRVVK